MLNYQRVVRNLVVTKTLPTPRLRHLGIPHQDLQDAGAGASEQRLPASTAARARTTATFNCNNDGDEPRNHGDLNHSSQKSKVQGSTFGCGTIIFIHCNSSASNAE